MTKPKRPRAAPLPVRQKNLTFTISAPNHEKIRQYAFASNLSLSCFVRNIIEGWLDGAALSLPKPKLPEFRKRKVVGITGLPRILMDLREAQEDNS